MATRQRGENGLGMTPTRAAYEIQKLRRLFQLLPPTIGVFDAWQRLVLDLGVSGKQTHDAHLVATMVVHGIDTILTFNTKDFVRYPGITVLDPVNILKSVACSKYLE